MRTGTATSNPRPIWGPMNSGGVTPMIVNGTLFRLMVRPMASAAPPNWRCQKAWLITATVESAPPPRRSFAVVNVLPRIALTPNTSKNSPLAHSPSTGLASPPCDMSNR